MQEEQEPEPPPDQEPDPPPEPADPAFTFTTGEDAEASKAAKAKKKKAAKQKERRNQKACEEGRVPGQAGRPCARDLREEHEARFAEQHGLDLEHCRHPHFVTLTAEHYLLLMDFARTSLPNDTSLRSPTG